MADLGPAFLTLAGTAVGAALTFVTGRSTRKSAERIANQRLLEDRLQVARQLAVDAYATALDAVELLHDVYVEDSVLESHSAEFEPQYRENIRRVREARLSLHKVSALMGSGALSVAAADVARALGGLEDAWSSARFSAKWMYAKRDDKRSAERFAASMKKLAAVRKELIGVSAVLPRDEVALGVPTDESLFGQLRIAINKPVGDGLVHRL